MNLRERIPAKVKENNILAEDDARFIFPTLTVK